MIIDNAGTYTLRYTATDDCGKTTTVDRELVVAEPVHLYGVIWNAGEHSDWTRIGESALFESPQPAVNNGTGSSPFDDIYPWSDIEVVEDANAGTLVKIPKYYYKRTIDISGTIELMISPNEQDGFSVSPAHADRGDGVGERDVVYVGRYHCCDANYKSATGDIPKSNMTRDNFRTEIHNLGTDIWQYDYAMFWTIAMLYLVEFADWNSQSMIGVGCGNGSAKEAMGSTDAMQYHTGTNALTRSDYGQVQYRHIEGLWSNVNDFCDGIYFDSTNVYAIKNPAMFSDTTNGTNIGAQFKNNGWIRNFISPTVGVGFDYALLPQADTTTPNRITDNASYNNTYPVLCVGGYYTQNTSQQYGLFYQNRLDADRKRAWVGSRLMKLPNA